MDTDKSPRSAVSRLFLASLCGLVSLYSHTSVASSNTVEPKQSIGVEALQAVCERRHNCTYQVEGDRPGTTSTVYELSGLKLVVPDEFFADWMLHAKPATIGSVLGVWLPDLTPVTLEQRRQGAMKDIQKKRNALTVIFYDSERRLRAVSAQALEDDMVSRRSAPQPVPSIPGLQEYALEGSPSYFRATDLNIRYPDGLPVYFGCHGEPVIFGYDPVLNVKGAECVMKMMWPNGFVVELRFDQSQLPNWQTVLQQGTEYLKRFEVNHRLPSGTLALD